MQLHNDKLYLMIIEPIAELHSYRSYTESGRSISMQASWRYYFIVKGRESDPTDASANCQ